MTVSAVPLEGPFVRWRGRLGRVSVTPFAILSWVLSAGIVFLIVYPLVRMIGRTFVHDWTFDGSAVSAVLHAPWLLGTLTNTAILVVATGVLAIVIGSLLAWLNERTDARLGLVGDILPLVPMLLPAIALAIGWVFLASSGGGFVNGWIAATLGRIGLGFRIDVVSWPGLVFIYTLHAVPYVYLIVAAALRNIDPALEEASRTSGAGTWRTFRKVSLPAVKPALFASSLLVVIMGLSHYSIAIIIANRAQIDVISVRIMRLLIVDMPPHLDQATVVSVFLLIVVSAVWFMQRKVLALGNFATIGGKSSQQTIVRLGAYRWVARALMLLYILCAAVLPLLALLIVALQPFWTMKVDPSVFTLGNFYQVLVLTTVTREAFRNSILLGLGGGVLAMFIATIVVLYSRSAPPSIGRFLDGITKLPAALSHLAIAVGFLVGFAGPPFYLGGSILMLLLVYIVLFMPEASITANAAVSQVGRELIEASRTSGASEGRTFRRVIIPLILPGLLSGFSLVFVLITGEVTASSLLAKVGTPVIGFAIRDIWEMGTFGNLAALASAFTVLNIIVVLTAFRLGRRQTAKR
jgi:iron(III) transport system permease protein